MLIFIQYLIQINNTHNLTYFDHMLSRREKTMSKLKSTKLITENLDIF